MKVETTALSIKHIAQMYCVNGKHFADVDRNKISGYHKWWGDELSLGFYFNAANIGPYIQSLTGMKKGHKSLSNL